MTIIPLSFLLYILIVNIFASPIYEYISLKVENDLHGTLNSPLTSVRCGQLIIEEIKKVLFISTVSLGMLAIPISAIFTPIVITFFAGWEMYDYPLARRGWSFRKRLRFVKQHFMRILGLGCWMIIPGLQFMTVPLAVTAGTMLATEDINKTQ